MYKSFIFTEIKDIKSASCKLCFFSGVWLPECFSWGCYCILFSCKDKKCIHFFSFKTNTISVVVLVFLNNFHNFLAVYHMSTVPSTVVWGEDHINQFNHTSLSLQVCEQNTNIKVYFECSFAEEFCFSEMIYYSIANNNKY